MKNILRFLFLSIIFSIFLSGAFFIWQHKEHYFSVGKQQKYSFTDRYDLVEISNVEQVSPNLPNISKYTPAVLKQKMPPLSAGEIEVLPLQEGYPKVRSQIPYFGDKQSRLDPLSIVILSGVVDLNKIVEQVNDKTLIERIADRSFILHVPLMVRKEATLIVQKGETLLMSATEGAMLPVLGALHINGATIIGWDVQQDQPAYYKKAQEFRPYIVAWCGSELNISDSHLGHLGYDHPKAYGVSYSSCENNKYVEEGTPLTSGTGWIVDSKFEQLYFGFYSYETEGAVLIGNEYIDNIVYGIDPHDRSKNLIIANNIVLGAQEKHGIIVSREVQDSYIFNNRSENNAGTGIMIDRNSQNNVIAQNTSRYNGHDGLSFYESPNNLSYKNLLVGNGGSGLRVRNSWGITSQEDVINNNENHGVQLYTQELASRDMSIDVYKKRAELSVVQAEVIGNKKGVFKLERFDKFEAVDLQLYEISGKLFSGDINGVKRTIFDGGEGIFLKSKTLH